MHALKGAWNRKWMAQAKSKSLALLGNYYSHSYLTQLIKRWCGLHNTVQPPGYTLGYNCQLQSASNYPSVALSAHIRLVCCWICTEKMAPVHQWIEHDAKSSKVRLHLPGLGLRFSCGHPCYICMHLLYYKVVWIKTDIKLHNLNANINIKA